MKCTVQIKVHGVTDPITVEVELKDNLDVPSSTLTSNQLLDEIVKDNDHLTELAGYVQDSYTMDTRTLDIDEVLRDPSISNATIETLQTRFAGITFPENLSDIQILLVDSLKIGNKYFSGRFINSLGKEMFIIENNEQDVYKFAKFLKTRQFLEETTINLEDGILKKIAENEQIEDDDKIKVLLLNFLENPEKFKSKFYNDNGKKSAFVYLDDYTRKLAGRNLRRSYENTLVNTVYQFTTWKNNSKTGNLKVTLDIQDFARILKQVDGTIMNSLGLNIKDITQEKLLSTDFNRQTKDGDNIFGNIPIDEKDTLVDVLFKYLTSLDNSFYFKVVDVSPDTIEIQEQKRTITEEFSIAYNQQFWESMEPYNGFYIYSYNKEGKTVYYYSKDMVSDRTRITTYNSKEEIKSAIDKRRGNERLNTPRVMFNHRAINTTTDGQVAKAPKYIDTLTGYTGILTSKTIVTIPDIHVDTSKKFKNRREERLITSKTYSDFVDYINSLEIDGTTKTIIKTNINTAYKAALYLYYINQTLDTDKRDKDIEGKLGYAANKIGEAGLISYYISTGWSTSKNSNTYKVVPVDADEIKNIKDSKKPIITPLERELNNLASNLKKLGVEVNLKNSEDIKKMRLNIDTTTTKAFIYNGEIYVNTTIATSQDLMHEYTHIFLGILKTNPKTRERYEQLLYSYYENMTDYERKQIEATYKGLSKLDQIEEAFANKFAQYILGNARENTLFKEIKKGLENKLDSIFSEGTISISTLYQGKASDIFKRLSHDIALLLGEKDLENHLDLNSVTQTRKITNFISSEISKGNIDQNCF